jgi:hypothetical protein
MRSVVGKGPSRPDSQRFLRVRVAVESSQNQVQDDLSTYETTVVSLSFVYVCVARYRT